MADLRTSLELNKLAAELGADGAEVAFLSVLSVDQIRDLRGVLSTAIFARNEGRVRRLAALTTLVPAALSARIAEMALGPALSARVASVLDGSVAARLAGHLSPEFLAEVSVHLDPTRVGPIVSGLPEYLIVDTGRTLIKAKQHAALGRLVAVVSPEAALKVVDVADGHDMLQIALYADQPEALDRIVAGLPEDKVIDVLRAAGESGDYDAAVSMLTSLSRESSARLIRNVGVVPAETRAELVESVARHRVWASVVPALPEIEPGVMSDLVNVPVTLDPDVIDQVLLAAYELDQAPVLVRLVVALDDAHVEALKGSREVRRPDIQAWLVERSGSSRLIVNAVLEVLGVR